LGSVAKIKELCVKPINSYLNKILLNLFFITHFIALLVKKNKQTKMETFSINMRFSHCGVENIWITRLIGLYLHRFFSGNKNHI